MRVLVEGTDIFDVDVLKDGTWRFKWSDIYGPHHHDYKEQQVRKWLIEEESWTIIADGQPAETDELDISEHYAAAFNMWMDEYVNDPQAFETSYDSAMRHVSEKLGGHTPSYGEVAAEQFKVYLEKVRSE